MLNRMKSARPKSVAPKSGQALLTLGALGVVFGDIGTSPLYSLHTAFSMQHNKVEVTQENVYGIISMVLWTITLIVTVKYVMLVTRADNQGQGGILALVALLKNRGHWGKFVAVAGMLGAALFYGDVVITPAISVLSATEGLTVISPSFERFILPVSLAVLIAIFAIQPLGTEKVGKAFGPIMLLWFVTLAGLGIPQIIGHPEILQSLSPHWALRLIVAEPFQAFVLLGAVVLTVTGAEALYADMGHFGARPIRVAWFCVVMPALILTYLGQGALVINQPEAVRNPMFYLAPEGLRIPLVILATIATVIASQAVISGAYSLTKQAVNLKLLPRMVIRHTSRKEEGQIYMPLVNGLLFVSVMVVVLVFRSSESLASAYGLAVTGTLVLVSVLYLIYVHTTWWKTALFIVLIGIPEVLLFASNTTKIHDGGWLPLLIAAVLIVVMRTWEWGSDRVNQERAELELPMDKFLEKLDQPHNIGLRKVAEVAVFPHGTSDTVPLSLVRCVKDLKLLYREIVIVRIVQEHVPHVPPEERAEMEVLHHAPIRVVRVDLHLGYFDEQNLPEHLHAIDPTWDNATYFLSALTLRSRLPGKIAGWRDRLYLSMERNQASRTESFKLQPSKTITVGTELHL
ncbi:putative secondary K+ uptake permease, K+ uptake permease (KUP) family [Corynebacterium glutamicum MB001]|nr:potassium transporter Kup [Corynebacterium glutamicum]AGT04705.1 putative secondary K+ uptake permease, K+ uptake permease (KUP) family [Corynebacterium glutamicum MB001]CAF19417.1 K+ potassium transporter [Corynebacterium glutamicum ATCC 13032]CCH23902.1 K+ transporter [Corynebacterium glutamicum K051]ARV65090.1 potassium transporter Kup [Corynebacterium glutamicum]ASW13436.1 putative secondary K+ uptake permease, K+ uptake permease (KUP) family [Corynebacterium glutamicum]